MVYIINGNTSTGKTTYIRNYISNNPDKAVRYFTDEEWLELLIDCLKLYEYQELAQKMTGDADVIFIDNIDFFSGKNEVQKLTAFIVASLCDKTDFYLSGISLDKRIKVMLCEFERMGVSVSYVQYNQ